MGTSPLYIGFLLKSVRCDPAKRSAADLGGRGAAALRDQSALPGGAFLEEHGIFLHEVLLVDSVLAHRNGPMNVSSVPSHR